MGLTVVASRVTRPPWGKLTQRSGKTQFIAAFNRHSLRYPHYCKQLNYFQRCSSQESKDQAIIAGSAGRSSGSSSQQGTRAKRRWLPWLIASAVLLPSAKLAWAIYPLLTPDSDPIKDVNVLRDLLSASKREQLARSWGWLMSEASDRLIRDVYIALCILFDYTRNGAGVDDWDDIHQRGANKLLKLCEVNRGIYIKLGQHIGQLDYLLPPQYVQTLKILMHAAPRDTFDQVSSVMKEEFGKLPSEMFESFDETPIASASLAQVHKAVMKDTHQVVAVKVQHLGLRETSAADLFAIRFIVYAVKALYPKFDYQWLADEVSENLPRELDFANEAENCIRTQMAFAHRPNVVTPAVFKKCTSSRVLTMSFEEGVYSNDVEKINRMNLNPADVATLIAEAFAEQIFVQGRVHCDPHFANMLIRPSPQHPRKPQLVLLDHGLYRDLPKDLRLNYAKLWRAIIFGDEAAIRKYSGRMNAGNMYKMWASMLTTKSFNKIVDQPGKLDKLRVTGSADLKATKRHVQQYHAEIGDVLRTVPRELLLILKTNDCLRNVDMSLGAPSNNFIVSARYIQRALNAERLVSHPTLYSYLANMYDTLALEVRLWAAQWYFSSSRSTAKQKTLT